jgi:hypothetical protein
MGWMGGWGIGGALDEDVCMQSAAVSVGWLGGLESSYCDSENSCLRKDNTCQNHDERPVQSVAHHGWRMMLGWMGWDELHGFYGMERSFSKNVPKKTSYSRRVGVDFDHESDADSDHLLKLVGGVIWRISDWIGME